MYPGVASGLCFSFVSFPYNIMHFLVTTIRRNVLTFSLSVFGGITGIQEVPFPARFVEETVLLLCFRDGGGGSLSVQSVCDDAFFILARIFFPCDALEVVLFRDFLFVCTSFPQYQHLLLCDLGAGFYLLLYLLAAAVSRLVKELFDNEA